MGYAIIVVALLVFLVVFLAGQDPDLLIDILSAVAIFAWIAQVDAHQRQVSKALDKKLDALRSQLSQRD